MNLKRKASNGNVKLGIIIIATQPEYIIMNGAHLGCPCTLLPFYVMPHSFPCILHVVSYAPKCVMWFVWLLYVIRDLPANSDCMLKFI